MEVNGFSYNPNHFSIYQGLPTKLLIKGVNTYGCTSVFVIPKYGITKYLQQGVDNEIDFTPTEPGEVRFSCSMGMYGGTFTVVARPGGAAQAPNIQPVMVANAASDEPSCAQGSPGCNIQVANISIGSGGYYPREITVKKGIPTELIVDDQIPLGGCMGTVVIPEYNAAKTLKVGKNKIAFNPTRTGAFPITYSMGARMAQLTVVD